MPRPRVPRPDLSRPLGAVRSAWQTVVDRWLLLGVYARRRIMAAALAIVIVLVVVFAAVPNLPCQFPGGDTCPQEDHAIALVPADAVLYAHFEIGTDNTQYKSAAAIAAALPQISRKLGSTAESRLPALRAAGLAPGLKRADWVGDEAAVAELPAGGVELIGVSDEDAAKKFVAEKPLGGAQLVHGFVVAGPAAAVKEVSDTAAGANDTTSLAADSNFQNTRSDLPDPRFADVYIAPGGVGPESGPDPGLAGLLSLLGGEAYRGATAALVAESSSLELSIHSVLDPRGPKPLGGLGTFTPSLLRSLPSDSLVYLGFGHPGSDQTSPPAFASTLSKLVGGPSSKELDKTFRKLVPALGEESALALAPPSAPAGVPEGPPGLQLLAAGADAKGARRALGPKGLGAASDLSDGTVRAASSPEGLAELRKPDGSLATSASFNSATGGLNAAPAVEVFVDLAKLRPLFEAAGLAANPAYARVAPEVRRLLALGLTVAPSAGALDTDLRLVIDAG
jgi:hypothetical protein